MSNDHQPDGPRLRRQIGLATAAAVVVGEVIGVGIFLTPAGMTKAVGSPFYYLVFRRADAARARRRNQAHDLD